MDAQPKARARVQANFKIQSTSKKRVDLMASALGLEKSEVVDQAIELLAKEKSPQIRKFLNAARASLQELDGAHPLGAMYLGKKPRTKFAGGPVPRKG